MGMRTRSEPVPALLDREAERAALDALLGDVRAGRGRAQVVRGEAGVGKSALLDYVAGAAADMQVARAAGAESEMELAFASLHLLCAPLLDRLERLPTPQRDALETAFGGPGAGRGGMAAAAAFLQRRGRVDGRTRTAGRAGPGGRAGECPGRRVRCGGRAARRSGGGTVG
jgi:hypothetical protein